MMDVDDVIERMARGGRGRWAVVNEEGDVFRHRRKSAARALVAQHENAGIRARIRRWTNDLASYSRDRECFEVTDSRWLP